MSTDNSTRLDKASLAAPPQAWFGVSAVFHYLGPAFAVLLFPAIGVLGVAWFRVASAALFFAPITKPWRTIRDANASTRLLLIGLGICLASMNLSFYLALDRLPMSLVAAMEFVGVILIALYGVRIRRNVFAFLAVLIGVVVLIDFKWSSDIIGLSWAAINAALFSVYVMLGHKAAETGASGGVQRLGAAMAIAFLILMPIGFAEALKVFDRPLLVLAGIGVGLCSSVVPYVCDQLAMARLSRASFALMLAILPAAATIIAAIVLAQLPTVSDLIGVSLVMFGVAIHVPGERSHDNVNIERAGNEV